MKQFSYTPDRDEREFESFLAELQYDSTPPRKKKKSPKKKPEPEARCPKTAYPPPPIAPAIDLKNVSPEFLMGLIPREPAFSASFKALPKDYLGAGENRLGFPFLLVEACNKFMAMADAAKTETNGKIILKAVSATRTFEDQRCIWERKWLKTKISNEVTRAKKILEFSAMPGASRHHWGTDVDIFSTESGAFKCGKPGAAIYEWLLRNAHRFGFCQPYTPKEYGRTGYKEEKWHWSYMPISSLLLQQYAQLKSQDIAKLEFFGAQHAAHPDIDIVNRYVKGVHFSCRPTP